MKTGIIVIAVLFVLFFIGWLGLRIKPAPFASLPRTTSEPQTVELPAGLPKPVERFFRVTYGERIPVIETAILSGRGKINLFGLNFPIRFRFVHRAGRDFLSDMDLTFFGLPIMKAHETFVDGTGFGRTPGGVDRGDWFNQSANIRMWAEALDWFPAVTATDPRVRWQGLDDDTALLIVPLGKGTDTLLVRFDPASGRIAFIEAMKAKSAAGKVLWVNAVWMDDPRQWIWLDIEDTLLNADVAPFFSAAEGA